MQIWVDADACPQVIKEILFRAAERAQVLTTLVANTPLRTPPSPFIRSVRVAQGFDVADHRIVQQVQPGDLVITADIPLAAEVIARGAHALDPRGELYSEDNVRERLA
ncbi:MAG: YaiI/YqxD family protein, partial [candidate division NC10 bacterium]